MTKSRPLIAIVDDEESVRRALQRLMISTGAKVEVFASGAEFLDALNVRRPDCVVLDLHMPSMSGFEVQERLAHAGQHVPVVAITGHDTPESKARALEAGASAYLSKPVNAKLLMQTIEAALDAGSSTC